MALATASVVISVWPCSVLALDTGRCRTKLAPDTAGAGSPFLHKKQRCGDFGRCSAKVPRAAKTQQVSSLRHSRRGTANLSFPCRVGASRVSAEHSYFYFRRCPSQGWRRWPSHRVAPGSAGKHRGPGDTMFVNLPKSSACQQFRSSLDSF